MKRFTALSTLQIRFLLKKMIRKYPVFVVAIDQLKYIKARRFAIVLNNEPHYMAGMHWIALYKGSKSRTLEIFCSYGVLAQNYGKEITEFAKLHNLHIVQNTERFQAQNSMMCGYFSLYFLFFRNKGLSFLKVLDMMKKQSLKKTEKNCKLLFSQIKFPLFSKCRLACAKWCKMNNLDFSSVCIQKNKKCYKI